MVVIATAGHVDHGKSALVRALTGTEPDRWDAERKRGLTIDLGYAWTTLDDGRTISFVDVPGHQRFIGNMLAGVGPAASVMFVVAADEGWRQQSEEHLRAIDALGIEHGLLVVTRSDLADPSPALADARARIAQTSLGEVDAVTVSALTGTGIADLRVALGVLAESLPESRREGRARMWIDRAFTIRGAGTVVTGTLGEGSIRSGEQVQLAAPAGGSDRARVRGLHSLDQSVDVVAATARTAVNIPSVDVDRVGRGDALLTGDWPLTPAVDVRLRGVAGTDLPEQLMLHVGTYAGQVRVRPLGSDAARLQLPDPLPLALGDRAILRNPGLQHVVGGVEVLDIDPPELRRRGAAVRRGDRLLSYDDPQQRLIDEVSRRGAAAEGDLAARGHSVPDGEIPGIKRIDGWLVSERQWLEWSDRLRGLVDDQAERDPLEPSLAQDAVIGALGLPVRGWLEPLSIAAEAEVKAGRAQRIGVRPSLAAAEAGLAAIEARLADQPWAAPDQHDLDDAGLGPRELAAAVRLGRILRLPGDVVLLPTGPALAMRELARLPQPFTASDARQALSTTRRVAIPLLEHLDSRGWTRRLDGNRREIVR